MCCMPRLADSPHSMVNGSATCAGTASSQVRSAVFTTSVTAHARACCAPHCSPGASAVSIHSRRAHTRARCAGCGISARLLCTTRPQRGQKQQRCHHDGHLGRAPAQVEPGCVPAHGVWKRREKSEVTRVHQWVLQGSACSNKVACVRAVFGSTESTLVKFQPLKGKHQHNRATLQHIVSRTQERAPATGICTAQTAPASPGSCAGLLVHCGHLAAMPSSKACTVTAV